MIVLAPWSDPRLARKPGILPLEPQAWHAPGADTEAQMAERVRLIAEARERVYGALPAAAAAQAELLEALEAHLGRAAAGNDAPLIEAGRMVQEDFCILQQLEPGAEYVLTAAILCFPSRWSLAEKLGRALTAIHDPVPDYSTDLAKRVNRLFEGVRAGRPLWRANWTVHPSDTLFQPSGESRADEPANGPLFIRVERQTFLRLPRTGAVVFGIRTYVDPLEALDAAQATSLRASLSELGPHEIAYRGGPALHGATMARLDAIAGR